MTKRAFLLVFGFCFLAFQAFGQNKTRLNWYFGDNPVRKLVFGETTQDAGMSGEINLTNYGRLGAAVATNTLNGDVLFFTNGLQVYDTYEDLMPAGNLSAQQLVHNQAVALAPVPDNDERYYIFTKKPSGDIVYAVVDMSLAGNSSVPEHPLGDVTLSEQSTGITAGEGMLSVTSQDMSNYWLIVQDPVSGIVRAYPVEDYTVSGNALGTSVDYNLSSQVSGSYEVSNFNYHAGTQKMALAPVEYGQNVLLFDFDETSGALTYDTTLIGSGSRGTASTPVAVYDTEFSSDGSQVYISVQGTASEPGSLWQYVLDSLSLSPMEINGPQWDESWGLQLGPDGMVYHLYGSPSANAIKVGRFTMPDSIPLPVNYEEDPFDNSEIEARQFPTFSPPRDLNLTIDFESYNTCQNNPAQFFAIFNDRETPDRFEWDFGGQASATGPSPVYTFEEANTVPVTLTAYWGDNSSTITKNITITQFELQIQVQDVNGRTVQSDTVVCPDDYPLQLTATAQSGGGGGAGGGTGGGGTGGGSSSTFYWSHLDGQAGAEAQIDSAGVYWVTTEDGSGCMTYTSIRVRTYGEEVQTANVWYFGNQAGIDFNDENGAIALTDGVMNTPEGAATISDDNGQLLFYTDGEDIYDRTHTLMPNGEDIGGSNLSSQSVLIVAYPDDPTLYYVFTTDQIPGDRTYNLRYTMVDLKANGGLGDVAEGESGLIKGIPLFDASTERLTALQGAGGAWVLAHEYGNNTFRAYLLTPDGIGDPVQSAVGSTHTFQDSQLAKGYMKLSNDAGKLAVPLGGSPPMLELFRFDTTGVVSDPLQIELPGSGLSPYGVEFSPGGGKVLVSLTGYEGSGSGSMLVEYRVDSAVFYADDAENLIKNSENIIIPQQSGLELGALQLAPDGQIYMAINNSSYLGLVFANEDTAGVSSADIATGFDLAGRTSSMGLPNQVQNNGDQFDEPAWEVGPTACVGDSTEFSATPSSNIDTYAWDFGDGGTSEEQNPVYIYENPGTYTVSLKIMNRCLESSSNPEGIVEEFSQEVNVGAIPDDPVFQVVGENSPLDGGYGLCAGEGAQIEVLPNEPGLIYVWDTGDTSRVITVNEQRVYGVTIYNEAGCSSEGELTVIEGRPQVDLGPDLNLCSGDALELDAANPEATFVWSTLTGGLLPETGRYLRIDSVVTGQTTYIVEVTSPEPFNCVALDTVVVTVAPTPDFSAVTVDNSSIDCNIGNGSITLQTSGSGNFTFNWSHGPTTQNVSALTGGTYSVTITDNSSGCTQVLSDLIIQDEQAGFTIDNVSVQMADCNDQNGVAVVTLDNDAFPVEYDVIQNGSIISTQTNVPNEGANNFTVNGLATGTYTIEVRQQGNSCVQNDQFTIDSPQNVVLRAEYSMDGTNFQPVQGDVQACVGDEVTLRGVSSDPDVAMLWGSGAEEMTTNVPGTYSLSGSHTSGLMCDSTMQVNVLYNTFSVSVEQEGPLCMDRQDTSVVVLRALPDPVPSSASYRWYKMNGTIANEISGGVGPELRTNEPGRYRVVAMSDDTGCRTEFDYQVNGVEVALHSLNDLYYLCPDNAAGGEVTLDPGEFDQYEWQLPNGQTSNDPVVIAQSEGFYRVTLTDGDCVTNATTEVRLKCEPIVFIPNAFTPNQDGLNDVFKIEVSNFVVDFEVFIYNRWGELIFASSDPQFEWTGVYKGKKAPLGTYAYLINYKNQLEPESGQQQVRGGVALIR